MNKFWKSSAVFSFFTLISRIFGYLRDLVLTSLLGASSAHDIFVVIFRIPNVFRSFFGEGALSQSLVPSILEAKANLLKQLDIQTLDDDEPLAVASLDAPPSRSVSMAPLDLGPLTAASVPPSQSINPETIASLDSVGLPFFAKDGGLASIEPKKFKKPQVVS